MSIKAVLWDIDGTLVDSEPLHLKALLAVCEQFGVDISDLPDDAFIGVNMNQVWDVLRDRFPAELNVDAWKALIDDHYVGGSEALSVMPGALETIHGLHELGIRQAAVSNSGRKVVDANLAFLNVEDVFEFAISLDDVSQGKPSPIPYLQALAAMTLERPEALVVEDSLAGARSAQAAGLTLVAYKNRHLSSSIWIDDLRQLIGHLQEA